MTTIVVCCIVIKLNTHVLETHFLVLLFDNVTLTKFMILILTIFNLINANGAVVLRPDK